MQKRIRDAQLLVKLFRKGDNFFRKRVNLFRKVVYSVRKANINKYHFLVTGSSFILCIALFPYHGDSSGAILEVPSEALLHLSVISRSSLGKMRQGTREGNLKIWCRV